MLIGGQLWVLMNKIAKIADINFKSQFLLCLWFAWHFAMCNICCILITIIERNSLIAFGRLENRHRREATPLSWQSGGGDKAGTETQVFPTPGLVQ